MTPWNDNKAWIQGTGNLTLGLGQDDGANDATHTWAKGDVWLNVPLWQLTSFTQALTLARTSAGLYTSALAAAGLPADATFHAFTPPR